MTRTAYIAPSGFAHELEEELSALGPWKRVLPDLYLTDRPAEMVAWAANIWFEVEELPVESIGTAAKALRQRGPWWAMHPGASVRRSQLIADKLLKRKPQRWAIPPAKEPVPHGAFTLLDGERMLVARGTHRPFAGGAPELAEDREGPPSRAYLKLWEALLLLGDRPGPGDSVWDLGAAPGAWTWTLAGLGCDVRSIDRAALDPRVDDLPNVDHRIGSAFALDPVEDASDWLVSDIISYPERILTLIERWRDAGRCQKFVITIKFQGAPAPNALRPFAALPNSVVCHLHHNKHEVTWFGHPALSGDQPRPWPWLSA